MYVGGFFVVVNNWRGYTAFDFPLRFFNASVALGYFTTIVKLFFGSRGEFGDCEEFPFFVNFIWL